jgi:glycerol kinase
MTMTKARYVLALDQGTSSSRAVLFDERARPVAIRQHEVRSTYPAPGWVEQDADELVETQLHAARDALAEAGVPPAAVAAIGIANQRETTIAWDARGRPLGPAIVWQDRRTSAACDALTAAGHGPAIRARTGLVIDPYFSATKMRWLLDAIPDGRRRAEDGELRLGTVDAYLASRLTGGATFATDVSNASRTMLLDLATRRWAPDMLELFGIPLACLPEVRPTDADYGRLSPDLLGEPISVRAMAGDQQAALFGSGCFDPGQVKNTYGTGCFLLMNSGSGPPEPPRGLLGTVAWQRGAHDAVYALEGSVFVCGATVRWLRHGLRLIDQAADVEALAATERDSGGVVFVPAFVGLGAPWWDAGARGSIYGLTAGTTPGHIARAALEAIAHQTVDLLEALEAGGSPRVDVLRADGGAAVNDLLLQIQADLLVRPVQRAAVPETTALGAALLAGSAVGMWEEGELRSLARVGRVFEPQRDDAWRAEARGRWREAIARTLSRDRSEAQP